jgi:hypothetical protein
MTIKFAAGLALSIALGWTMAAQAAPVSTCYINDGFAVSAAQVADIDNQVFSVLRKQTADQAVSCPIDPAKADFVIGADSFGQTYSDLVGDLLVITTYNGQMSDLTILDLKTNTAVLAVSGTYDYATPDEIYYWERGEAGTKATCDNYDEITAMGLDIGQLHQKSFNLNTRASTATGETNCEGIS